MLCKTVDMQLTCASCFDQDQPDRFRRLERELDDAKEHLKHALDAKTLSDTAVVAQATELARLKRQLAQLAAKGQADDAVAEESEESYSVYKATVQHVSFIRECMEEATTAAGAFQQLLESKPFVAVAIDAPVVTPVVMEAVAPVEAVGQIVDSAAASAAAPVDSAEAPATPPFKAPPVKAPPGRHAKAPPPEVARLLQEMQEMREMRGKAPPPGPGVASAVAPVGSAEAPATPPVAVHLGVDAADPWEDGNPAAMNARRGVCVDADPWQKHRPEYSDGW